MWSSSKAAQKVFLKILLKRVNHFLKEQLPECSLHEMWSSSKAAQKVFFKNLSEESKPLFGGAASRMFCTCDVKQLKMYFLKILLKRVKHFLKGPLVECSLHEMWSSSKSIFKNLSEESKTLFGGMASRMFYTHFPWSRDTGQAFKNYKSRWSLLTVQSCFNSHRGNTSKFLLKRVDHFFGCSIQKVLYMRCEAAQKQLKKYF